MDNIAEMFF